jgi:hypothetical protein
MLFLPINLKHNFYRQLSTNSNHNNDSSVYPFYIKNFNKLLEIFIGLIDGDGYIEIGPQKQYSKFSNSKYHTKSTIRSRIVLRLQAKDRELLNLIANILKIGKIDELKSKNQYRLIIHKTDIFNIIYPFLTNNNIEFLVYNRRKQFFLLKYIIENNIKYWEDINLNKINNLFIESNKKLEFVDIVNLPYFNNWLVGFTTAEGSFHIKARGTAHFSIVQFGIENSHLIKAIHYFFKGPESFNHQIKPENFKVYRISFSSKKDLNLIINFFDTNNLVGLKKLQFDSWKSYIISKINDSAPNVILSKVSNNNNDNNNNINDSPLALKMEPPRSRAGLNKNYLNLIYGLLLGKSFIFNNNEIKLIIEIEGKHLSYIMDIHTKISSLGYCADKMPLIKTKILKKGNLSKVMQLHTYNNNNYLELYNK